ncbi:unnamed protein product [Spirodela intermedia]|uniref:Uncharacterized protein n=2 Tax=Spirodela intermedia TaxID=51605 RepID=A0A7I8K119_SPIIN|nr:unnamed protein product [Spirodela intermedia]CAA6655303.1 unnamed protein product [Spirodela intermedia]CAA7390532.1 unnamed protein product [Spirodela intermedia]
MQSYLPGRGSWVIKTAHSLGWRPPLHSGGAPAYHLPKWESGRHNLCQRGPAYARLPFNPNLKSLAKNHV